MLLVLQWLLETWTPSQCSTVRRASAPRSAWRHATERRRPSVPRASPSSPSQTTSSTVRPWPHHATCLLLFTLSHNSITCSCRSRDQAPVAQLGAEERPHQQTRLQLGQPGIRPRLRWRQHGVRVLAEHEETAEDRTAQRTAQEGERSELNSTRLFYLPRVLVMCTNTFIYSNCCTCM